MFEESLEYARMMRELELYDPERKPANWNDCLQPGQYAVFHLDVGTDLERTPEGRYLGPADKSTCMVFDSLPEAEQYCEGKVESVPRMRCDIYDHTGKSRLPLFTYVNKQYVKAPRNYARWGWLVIAVSLLCFWWEWARGWNLGLALIIGVNLFFAGLRLLYWGAGKSENRRSAREH